MQFVMIKYIKTINQERRQLRRGYRFLADVLSVVSLACAYFLLTSVYKQCFWQAACSMLQENEFLFWGIFPFAFMLAVSIGQVLVFGSLGLILVIRGELSAIEAVRLSFLYRMPQKWFG